MESGQKSERVIPLKRFQRSTKHYDEYDDDDDEDSSSSPDSSHSSWQSRSTAPTSLRSGNIAQKKRQSAMVQDEIPPLGYNFPHEDPSASVETYNSVFSDDESLEAVEEADDELEHMREREHSLPAPTDDDIPPVLPQYRASIVDPMVRPSTPDAFARLFPSMDRLSIRHDDLTPDGNMNLRVDVVVPSSSGRRPVTVQLFHLRMHDLARREFSLRRYCRDSGREVCNSKRAYAEPPRPGFQRSMSSAFRSVKHPFRRSGASMHSHQKRPSTSHSTNSSTWDTASIRSMQMRTESWSGETPPPPASTLVPTNSIKLEFSNYARVDVTRNSGNKSKRYDFEWWGHEYAWKRVHDQTLNVSSFHLIRDGHGSPVAYITPESRSPSQIDADEWAGGWVPPCHMWINDQSIIDAETDIADILVATGLIALVDNCIKERWHVKKQAHKAVRSSSNDFGHSPPRSIMRHLFNRRNSAQHTTSALRPDRTVHVY